MARPPGSRNKATMAWFQELRQGGITPVELLLERVRDEDEEMDVRIDCAKAAAPYCHPKIHAIAADLQAHVNITNDESQPPPLPRVCEIVAELVAGITEGDDEIVMPDGSVLPAPVRSE